MKRRGFTLIELLIVMGIMGLLGTIAVGSYRAMQRGMEERGTMQNVNQFIRSAYQRAQIDRLPVAVYFWNELLRAETDNDPMIVVGKAVAVRRAGRITEATGNYLYDEFGDLRFMHLTYINEGDDEERESSSSGSTKEGNGMFLYRMDGTESGFQRSVVSQTTKLMNATREPMLTAGGDAQIESYAYVIMDKKGVDWKRGDAYGFEFADIQLPHNFIFGQSYSTSADRPVTDIKVMRFKVSGNSGNGSTSGASGDATIQISNLRPGSSGALQAQKVATSDNPTKSL